MLRRWCVGGGCLLLCILALFPVLILGRLLAQETEHVLRRDSPLSVSMNRLVHSIFKEDDSKRLPAATVINPQQQQQHAIASLHHSPMSRVHGVEKQRILDNSKFADHGVSEQKILDYSQEFADHGVSEQRIFDNSKFADHGISEQKILDNSKFADHGVPEQRILDNSEFADHGVSEQKILNNSKFADHGESEHRILYDSEFADHGESERRMLDNAFVDYVNPGSNMNPGVGYPPIPGIVVPPPLHL